MEPVTTPFDDTEIRAQLARVKYDQKWDILKPVIRKLRMEDDRNLSEIITEIENIYGFKAQSAFHLHPLLHSANRPCSDQRITVQVSIQEMELEEIYPEHEERSTL
jgi:hypothetical protein